LPFASGRPCGSSTIPVRSWLDDRGTTLGAATQADVDTWLDGATRYRYLLRDFLTWTSARRLAGEITVPALPPSELNVWVPKTCATWAKVLQSAVGRSGMRRAGLGPTGGGMIFGLWA
jgi:hypothetical protein